MPKRPLTFGPKFRGHVSERKRVGHSCTMDLEPIPVRESLLEAIHSDMNARKG